MGCEAWSVSMKRFKCDAPGCEAQVEIQQLSPNPPPSGWDYKLGLYTCPKHVLVFLTLTSSSEEAVTYKEIS